MKLDTHVAELVRAVAAFEAPGSSLEGIAVAGDDWRSFLSLVGARRLTGLAVAGLEAGWLALEDAQAKELIARHRDAMFWVLGLERALLEVTEAFESEEIDAVVLKGSALAHSVYPDPAWRSYGDIDILVRSRDFRKAAATVAELGFRRELPEPRPGFDERFGKAAEFRREDGPEVDLHRTLVLGPFGLWLEADELVDRSTGFHIAGRRLRRLDDTALMLHACLHASLGMYPPLLMPLRDVVQVAGSGKVRWKVLAGLADRWRLRAVVGHALETARDTLGVGLPPDAEMLIERRASPLERRLLDSYVTDKRRRGGLALSTLRAIPGFSSKAGYLWALLYPGREFLNARMGVARSSYLRRWTVPVRWLTKKRRWT